MDALSPPPPAQPPGPLEAAPSLAERIVALIEVILCSDYPTQIILGQTFLTLGFQPTDAKGALQIGFVTTLALADSALLIGLMVVFLRSHGERPRDVFLGKRPILGEIHAGIPLTAVAFGLAVVVLLGVRAVAPWLRTVEHNPLQDLMRTRQSAALFALVVVVAGGVREELQRAFLLHRFERSLGGRHVGVIVASAAFGIGHIVQGADAVLATTVLGVFWATVYLRRRSVVAPMVSHAAFDLLQVAQFLALGH